MLRKCRTCNEDLPEEYFFYRGGGRNGLQADCIYCSRKRAREYRQSMRDKVSEYKMSIGCECCGFKPEHSCQLDLDHLKPKTKTYKGAHKAYDAGWSWNRIERELKLCQVLCKNCHALRTQKEGHWKSSVTQVRMRQSSAQS